MKKWEKIKVGNDGFVALVDVMGSDYSIVQAARISYGNDPRDTELNVALEDKDKNLIRYLMRHRHTTPFEMCELKFLVRCPMDTWRQWIRHRMASVNEYSTRYTEAIDSREITTFWRPQSVSNKQGSESGTIDTWPPGYTLHQLEGRWFLRVDGELQPQVSWDHEPTPGEYLSYIQSVWHSLAQTLYEEKLLFGVAREQARKDLPLSTYTEAYWKIDLHNLLHFLGLRMDSHAQQEIREFATVIGSIVEFYFPTVWQAFKDYRLDAITFSGPEMRCINGLSTDLSDREISELESKLTRFSKLKQ